MGFKIVSGERLWVLRLCRGKDNGFEIVSGERQGFLGRIYNHGGSWYLDREEDCMNNSVQT